jgi:hypothetical protein
MGADDERVSRASERGERHGVVGAVASSLSARAASALRGLRDPLRLVLGLAQLLALGIVAAGDFPPSGYPLDDAWIHQLAARTLVRTGTLGIDPAVYGSGASSLLWALVLAAGEALHLPPPGFSFAINTLLFLLSGQVLLALLLADGVPRGRALIMAVAFGVAPNFVWFTLSGMEAMLLVASSLLTLWAWLGDSTGQRRLAGVFLLLVATTRPEGLALAALLVLLRRPRGRAEWVSLAAPSAIGMGTAAAISLVRGAPLLPATLGGRRWMWLGPLEGLSGLDRAGLLLLQWLDRLAELTVGTSAPWVGWLVAGVFFIGVSAGVRGTRQRGLVGWTALHLSVYLCLLPAFGHAGRYQPLVPPLFLMFAAAGALELGRLSSLRWAVLRGTWPSRIGLAALVACLVVGPGSVLLVWQRGHADSVWHVHHTEVEMGRHLRHLPADARIASFDIGGIGYFSERKIIELGGLTSDDIVPALWAGTVGARLEQAKVNYLVMPLGLGGVPAEEPWNFQYRLGLTASPRVGLTPLFTLESPLALWRRGIKTTMHSAPRQVLYRVAYGEAAP